MPHPADTSDTRDTRDTGGIPVVANSLIPPADARERAAWLLALRSRAAGLAHSEAGPTRGLAAAAHTATGATAEDLPALLTALRDQREFAALLALCERLGLDAQAASPTLRRLQAQALIETGALTLAATSLQTLLDDARLPPAERLEAQGLLGRVHKQRFIELAAQQAQADDTVTAAAADAAQGRGGVTDSDPDNGQRSSPNRNPNSGLHSALRLTLAAAVAAYRAPYAAQPAQALWHGVNLLALLWRARRDGWRDIAADLDLDTLAAQLLGQLQARPQALRDDWHLATLAEVSLYFSLRSGDLQPVEDALALHLQSPGVQAFHVASTLRQFSQLWDIDTLRPGQSGHALADAARVQRLRHLVDILRLRLLQLPGGELQLATLATLAPDAADAATDADATAASTGTGRTIDGGPAAGAAGAAGAAVAADTADGGPAAAATAAAAAHSTPADTLADTPSAAPPDAPSDAQLEAILGSAGPQSYLWWRAGIDAARSVGVVRSRLGKRMGTGFLVRAGDFGLQPADERLLLTNFHVVNPQGLHRALLPADAEVVFEAVNAQRAYRVTALLWASPVAEHDASLLRLSGAPRGVPALALQDELPPRPSASATGAANSGGAAPPAAPAAARPRVYIIGHPGGRELSFSFQDNELLDHEGAPDGQPQQPGVCRVHYLAPTEGGNSGSPVFDDAQWRVIALHHSGGKMGMRRLNGAAGTYAANEGLALGPLLRAARAALKTG